MLHKQQVLEYQQRHYPDFCEYDTTTPLHRLHVTETPQPLLMIQEWKGENPVSIAMAMWFMVLFSLVPRPCMWEEEK